MRTYLATISAVFCLFTPAAAQPVDLSQIWPAHWIGHPDGPHKEYAVFHFSKSFELETVPDTLVVHSSGDNRYQLYVNGHLVAWGPQRGDLRHWHYESTDIAPHLKQGSNMIVATVINYGSHPPDAQVTVQTAFLLCADRSEYKYLNTNASWLVNHNRAYSPNIVDNTQVRGYYGGGSREMVDGTLFTWDWLAPAAGESTWKSAWAIESAKAKTCRWAGRWKLTPGTLPLADWVPEPPMTVRKVEGVSWASRDIGGLAVPAHETATVVLDRGYETTAFPTVTLSGGRGSVVRLTYVEAPYTGNPGAREKGNRNEIEGKQFFGYYDQYTSNGASDQYYTPLWWRAFRYIQLEITTEDQPLLVRDFSTVFSAYPYRKVSAWQAESPSGDGLDISKLLDIGIRTLRLCAHETYTDCPYYEESQFEGDTRVQALAGYYNFGDTRLQKNAIEQFAWSINDEGFLSARYPTNSMYYIPNYSLFWIGMLYDYMMHVDDPDLVRSQLPVMRLVLDYFNSRLRQDGTVKKPGYHNFVDWSFPMGEAPFGEDGYAALVDLHVLLGNQWAAAIEREVGSEEMAQAYVAVADRLTEAVQSLYWDANAELFRDVPGKELYSVHTNCMAIITGVSSGTEAAALMHKVLEREDLVQPTIYWHFYFFEALDKAGLGDRYLEHLDLWEQMMAAGCTTWPETGIRSRSECHGWGASPNYHMYKIVAGVEPAEAGFRSVHIAPDLGDLPGIDATMPHPRGYIRVDVDQVAGDGIAGTVELPAKTHGSFTWKGKTIRLTEGKNTIRP